MSQSPHLEQAKLLFEQNRNPINATPMKRYMRDKFEYYGIKSPQRRALSKQIIQEKGLLFGDELKQLCLECYQDDYREIQYFANDLIEKTAKKLDASFLDLAETLITTKSWWDTVDLLATKLVGALLLRYPELMVPYTSKWMASNNMWLQRTALIFQLPYKEQTRTDLLFKYILQLADSKEFFINKAAGWALRQYSRTDPMEVEAFIHSHDLAPLTVQEGLRLLRKKK